MARKGRKTNRNRNEAEERIQRAIENENEETRQNEEDGVEVVKIDPENEEELYGPQGETRLSFEIIDADNNEEKVMEEIDDFTDDQEIIQDFAERQRLINEGSDVLSEKLEQHHSLSPDLSGDDVDAAWEDSRVSGEESVGGSAPTPDQDVVDELGQAFGLKYEDYEPLHTAEKLEGRDQARWELNPASVEELEEQEDELADQDEKEAALYLEGDYDVAMLVDEDEEKDLDTEDEDEEELEEELLTDEFDEDDFDDLDLEDDEDEMDDYLDELDEED
jgi:hypothetical protein